MRAANAFAGELHRQLAPGNASSSPHGIAAAFAMCLAACDGATRDDSARVLHFEPATVHATMAALQQVLAAGAGDSLRIANRIWGQEGAADYYHYQSRSSSWCASTRPPTPGPTSPMIDQPPRRACARVSRSSRNSEAGSTAVTSSRSRARVHAT